jgi:hypothetical protein
MFSDKLDKVKMRTVLEKITVSVSITALLVLGNVTTNNAHAASTQKFPILDRLQSQGQPLAKETIKWIKKWRGINLDNPEFRFEELSGSTSINLKVRKLDATDSKGYKNYGSFVPRNGSANFNTEIAYFNLAAILGHDDIFRPATRYALGPKATQSFKLLLDTTPITGDLRLANKDRILTAIAKNRPLNGCLKANKLNTNIAYDAIADMPVAFPQFSNPIIAALQAINPLPVAGKMLQLEQGYKGDALQLAREYSILMTLDAIFQQWDRYSGDNVVIAKDDTGIAHFYTTDNGGAELTNDNTWLTRNLNWFSRYDRQTINQLKLLYGFLVNPSNGFLGYKNAELFVVDLGLYSEHTPTEYVALLKRNLGLLLKQVAQNRRKFGDKRVYFPQSRPR